VNNKLPNDGAVLVFLAGWSDISALLDQLTRSGGPFANQRFEVLPLHGQVPAAEQRRVFAATPGKRKIVLATNGAHRRRRRHRCCCSWTLLLCVCITQVVQAANC
jgi:HrpA-like RNA helicase